jgi:hypothetical protein
MQHINNLQCLRRAEGRQVRDGIVRQVDGHDATVGRAGLSELLCGIEGFREHRQTDRQSDRQTDRYEMGLSDRSTDTMQLWAGQG